MYARLTAILLAATGADSAGGGVHLEFVHSFAGEPLELGQPGEVAGGELSVSRLDYLLSGFALRRAGDGSWMEADASLVGFIGEGKKRRRIDLGTVPPGRYSGLRFHIGPDPHANAADPNLYPKGHALHPLHCGLHWGWQGGYIFLALEGHLREGGEVAGGFTYHLAEDRNRFAVELPLELDLIKRATVRVQFDLGKVFAGAQAIAPHRGEVSTHSREGDPLPDKLRANLPGAFRVRSVTGDQFHPQPEPAAAPAATGRGEPFPLRVATRLPAFELPADNPLTAEGVALGRRLFHDPLLSRDGTVSCASCHQREFAFGDPRRVSVGVGGATGTRNSMALANLLWSDEFFWDGHAPDLRQQVLEPVQDDREMGESLARVVRKLVEAEGYPGAFDAAFGGRAVTPGRIAKALEQFLLSLVSQESRFDKAMRGDVELTPEEKRGFQLFVTEKDPKVGLHGADCFHCHGGSLFGGQGYFDNGLGHDPADLGRYLVTGEAADRGKFKAPSLRNVAVTAPYMHDGRLATLEGVIDHYDSGVVRTPNLDPNLAKHPEAGLELSDGDKAALVAFLRTLTDEPFIGNAE